MNATGSRGAQLLGSGDRFDAQPGLMARLVSPGFQQILQHIDSGLAAGSLLAHLPDGSTRLLGGRAPGFEAEIHVRDWRALLRMASNGSIGSYQGYEAGDWHSDDLVALFALFAGNARSLGNTARSSGLLRWGAKLAHWFNRNSMAGSKRNIAAHYDLGNDFYRTWLDESMAYSSGLELGEDGLNPSQTRKFDQIATRIGAAENVLEIGCGWGGLAHYLGSKGKHVTAISLSQEQLRWAREHNQLSNVEYRAQDYRDITGQYDGVVSVEMVEALGRENWGTFMQSLARCLKPGGRAALQYISLADDLYEAYANSVDFIQAYVFPGGTLIKSSEFRALAQENGLEWHDQQDFGLDYAQTLKIWHERFDRAVAEKRLPAGFDDRFIRLWKFYLSYCEGGFRAGNIDVHQMTLIKR